jgi:hypothetical protein
MILKRSAVLLLACGALVAAGCGDDDDKSSDNKPAVTATTPAQTTAETTADDTTTAADTGDGAVNPQAQAAADACKQQVDSNAQLSAGAKSDIGKACDEIAKGDADKAKEAMKKVCLRIIDESGATGAAADAAKAACEATTQ